MQRDAANASLQAEMLSGDLAVFLESCVPALGCSDLASKQIYSWDGYHWDFPLFNYSLPTTKSALREIILLGTENSTSAFVDGKHAGDFVVGLDGTTTFQPIAFVAPVQHIGGPECTEVKSFIVWDGLQDVSKISQSK